MVWDKVLEAWDGWSKFIAPAPAIWLYPPDEIDVDVTVVFRGDGFMTYSQPAYSSGWHVTVDPTSPFRNCSERYIAGPSFGFLDYDGFRDGRFQRQRGWCIARDELLAWQRRTLPQLGYTESEIEDVNYTYGRLLIERRYPEAYFNVYPQDKEILDACVTLSIDPAPDTVHRLWLYFVPTDERSELPAPNLQPISRKGFTVVELGFLSDLEIIDEALPSAMRRAKSAGRLLSGIRERSFDRA
jgi:hypothetical protein